MKREKKKKKKRRQEKRKRKAGATRNRISGPSAPGRIVTTLPHGTHCEGIENFY